jgi:uncharacterized membrane protein YfcA
MTRRTFDALLGVLLLLVGIFVLLHRRMPIYIRTHRRGEIVRQLRDAEGHLYLYSYRPLRAVTIAFFAGFVSSLFGIGGGVLQVPAFVYLLNFPTHIAIATSQFMLMATGLTGFLTHLSSSPLEEGWRRTGMLVLGVVFGSQAGARLSSRLPGHQLHWVLGIALLIVAVRLLVSGLNLI